MKVSKLDCWREAVAANGSPEETLKLAQELHAWLNADEVAEPSIASTEHVIPFRPSPVIEHANRIRELRLARGWSLESLAERMDMSTSFVSRLERGARNLNLKQMNAFALAFGVQPAELHPSQSPIEEILKRYGGGITKLAAELGIKHQSFYAWKKIPAERVLEVEGITGIPREELRPDLYPPDVA